MLNSLLSSFSLLFPFRGRKVLSGESVTIRKFSIIKIANLIRFRDLMLEKNYKSFGIIITRMKCNKILSKLIIYELNETPNQLK